MSHFRFTSSSPGKVFVRNACDATSNEKEINLLKDISWLPQPSSLPSIVSPDGLSLQRQWYLYDKIREFCPLEVQDLVCPMPRKRLSSLSDEVDE